MGYDAALTATLTGVTVNQLNDWRRKKILVPEVSAGRPVEYSFRDLVALRVLAKLRVHTSLQQIRKALANLSEFEMVEHLSEYMFATDGKTVKVKTDSGFMNLNDRQVPDFMHPRTNLSVNPKRMGGFPTIRGSRVPYIDVAELYRSGELEPGEISDFYPGVTDEAARDAVDFHNSDLEVV